LEVKMKKIEAIIRQIFIYPVEEVIQVKMGERGETVL